MKILVVTQPKETGLTYHRQTVPHKHLTANYDMYKVDYTYDISQATKEQLSSYQIVSFLRIVNHQYKTVDLINKCKEAGCKTVIDIDDYWNLHPQHELKDAYEKNNIPAQTVDGLKNCDWVTTTTEHFADKIREFNKNVTVIPNSIDPTEMQFIPDPVESNKVRFGWIGGVYHAPDLKLIYSGFDKVWKTRHLDNFQFCLGGFTVNESYKFLEFIFTNRYTFPKDSSYIEYLKKYTIDDQSIMNDQPYKRLWGTDVFNYARLYNQIDVSMVPLVSNDFNACKSQIKIIEAGWFKKAVIVNKTKPYTIDCTDKNSVLIDNRKQNWVDGIKYLLYNPNKREDLAEALHETVKEKYNMNTVNKVRHELYQRLCE